MGKYIAYQLFFYICEGYCDVVNPLRKVSVEQNTDSNNNSFLITLRNLHLPSEQLLSETFWMFADELAFISIARNYQSFWNMQVKKLLETKSR